MDNVGETAPEGMLIKVSGEESPSVKTEEDSIFGEMDGGISMPRVISGRS